MRSLEFRFLSTQIVSDEIGHQKEKTVESCPIPIVKIEDVYASEFYEASEKGHKPSLRLRISALNYKNETELIYMNTIYSIIRVQDITADELILVCERKLKNVKEHKSGRIK